MAKREPLTDEQAAAELLRRAEARESLLKFTQYTHPRWRTEPYHEKLCFRLEQLERLAVCDSCGSKIDSLATFAPPRTGKTEIALRRFSSWVMGRNPGWSIISAMANGSLAADTGAEVRDIVADQFYRNVFPAIRLKKDAQAAYRWVVESIDPSVRDRGTYYCGGVDGSFPGRGCSVLNIDDPHKSAQEADSPRMRDLVAKFYFGDAVQRLEYPSIKLLTNTRRHQDDLAGRVLPDECDWIATDDQQFFCCGEWHVLRLRAIENEGTPYEVVMRSQACPPDKDPSEYMKRMRDLYISQGEARYWHSEYQQSPTPEEGTFCKSHWYDDRYEEVPDGLWIYMTSDVAVTEEGEGRDPDFTEHGVYGLDDVRTEDLIDENGGKSQIVTADSIYVLDWWYGQAAPDEWIREWIRLARKWRPVTWFGTKGVIKNAVEGYLIREAMSARVYTEIEWLADMKSKAAKGQALKGMSASGRFKFPKGVPWADRAIANIVAFPTASHDDAFDVAANMARSLLEIPASFSGCKRSPKPKKLDSWSTVGSSGRTKNWKGA